MKTKGGRKIQDRYFALLADDQSYAEQLRTLSSTVERIRSEVEPNAIFNPKLAKDALIAIGTIESQRREIEAKRAEIRDELHEVWSRIEPYLERASPTVDQRLSELEERIKALEQERGTGPRMELLSKTRGTGG